MPGESGSHLDMQYCADVHRAAVALESIAASLVLVASFLEATQSVNRAFDDMEAQTKGEADAAHRKTE
jgi:hypothetical protein